MADRSRDSESGRPRRGRSRFQLWLERRRERRANRPRIKKLRALLILAGLGVLALISTVFGMMMAVAQDLPQLEDRKEYEAAENSILLDRDGDKIGTLTGNQNRILVESRGISQNMKQAVVAIEDKRFYEHRGVDYQGIGRALWQDVRQQDARQGGSTITQQFVKNAQSAQNERTVFQKLREAALAYHLERDENWSKDKILKTYLNTIYFGEGAYGVESAARTYFGRINDCGTRGEDAPTGPDGLPLQQTAQTPQAAGGLNDTPAPDRERCAAELRPEQAALLAGVIASPSKFSPREHPEAAKARRDLVLQSMLDQGSITRQQHDEAVRERIPTSGDIEPPAEQSDVPYFTSWLRGTLVDRYGAGLTFGGGLRVQTTIDVELQQAVERVAQQKVGQIDPTTSIVVLDNRNAEVLAMLGGNNFDRRPFNLATNGHRQPGSAFKPFTLAGALEKGIPATKVYASQKKEFPVPNSKKEKFVVNNYEDKYLGSASLAAATTFSDNSVYAEVGVKDVGTKRIASLAERMGIETNVSTNPAMTLGGLKEGVTPLEMAHAYLTLAHGGERVTGSLAEYPGGPVAVERIEDSDGKRIDRNKVKTKRVLKQGTAEQVRQILGTVVSKGTGKRAAIGEFAAGKTGTTENNGDAWFVGFTDDVTVAVWVGHADTNKPMETQFGGRPVDGGTIPAQIWHDVVLAFNKIRDTRKAERDSKKKESDEGTTTSPGPATPVAPQGAGEGGGDGGGGGEPRRDRAPARPEPDEPPAPAEPAPEQPTPAPEGGGGGVAPSAQPPPG